MIGSERRSMSEGNAILQARGVWKGFPGVQALRAVDMDVLSGEIHALLGENGSGKSTLMKVIAGVYNPDQGEIRIDGERMGEWNPRISQHSGISAIYQELSLFPDLSVAENIFLGHIQFVRRGIVRWGHLIRQTRTLLGYLKEETIDPLCRVESLSIAQRQIVEIVKALAANRVRVLLMDEPTSALSLEEVDNLFEVMWRLRGDGVGIVFISHKLEEVIRIADRVTVLRDGEFIASHLSKDVTQEALIRMMIGRDLAPSGLRRSHRTGEMMLEVRNLTKRGAFEGISFQLYSGEILGFFGLVGSRRTDVAEALFGVSAADSGMLFLQGRQVRMAGTHAALASGIGLIPEDRATEGLVLSMSLTENVTLPVLARLFPLRVINHRLEEEVAQSTCADLEVKYGTIRDAVDSLSGGNKQKIVLAKWLLSKARILIFDEPTKGIDVGAKQVIHTLMEGLAARGVGIIMISSELPEILSMSDRVIVMASGRIVGQFDATEATQDSLMRCASSTRGATCAPKDRTG
jgi:rhamnose transport system ATP-binding protein